MRRTSDHFHRAFRQMCKAINRGDLDAAFKWTFIVERQAELLGRLIAIDEDDRRLKRHRSLALKTRNAMLALIQSKTSAKLAGGGR